MEKLARACKYEQWYTGSGQITTLVGLICVCGHQNILDHELLPTLWGIEYCTQGIERPVKTYTVQTDMKTYSKSCRKKKSVNYIKYNTNMRDQTRPGRMQLLSRVE